jgi:hypothetical protein
LDPAELARLKAGHGTHAAAWLPLASAGPYVVSGHGRHVALEVWAVASE